MIYHNLLMNVIFIIHKTHVLFLELNVKLVMKMDQLN